MSIQISLPVLKTAMYENVVMVWKAGYTHNWGWLMLVKMEESLFLTEIGKEMESPSRIIKKYLQKGRNPTGGARGP